MAGSDEERNKIPQSSRTKGIIQYFEKLVKTHNEGIDNDLLVTNEKIGQLKTAQIDTNTKLAEVEASFARMDKSLAALLRRFDDLHAKSTCGRDGDDKKNDDKDECIDDNWDTYGGDTEVDDQDRRRRRRRRSPWYRSRHRPWPCSCRSPSSRRHVPATDAATETARSRPAAPWRRTPTRRGSSPLTASPAAVTARTPAAGCKENG